MVSESWWVALEALRLNKVRALLAMLGVIIGTACIVLVVTVALTGKRYIIGQIEAVGANLVYAEHVSANADQGTALTDEMTLGDLQAVRNDIPQVIHVAGTREIPMTVVVNGAERPITLVGVTEGFETIRNLEILSGRFFDADDMTSHSKVCLLTQALAKLMFPAGDAVGHTARVGELSFTVIGVFRERVSTFGQSEIQEESVLIPFSLLSYYTGVNFVKTLYAQASSAAAVPLVTRDVQRLLQSRHRVGARYRVQNLTSILAAAQRIGTALTLTLLLVAVIALVISGIGIMNIMLVTVSERTREIGIRMAVGAQRMEILEQFLLEATFISGSGAIIGILLAVSVPLLIRPLLPGQLSVPISWLSVVVALTASAATGILFGYLPARRASSLQPVESLRHE
ncbi:MAG TPA: ABC transporter permease [Vicinamibacterales bacterium]|nr:ABC transporter permease [Vicinamibacterales bacterium]